MKNNALVLLCCVLLLSAGCQSKEKNNEKNVRDIAFRALAESILSDPAGDTQSGSGYEYQWRGDPANEIRHMNTMENKEQQLICEQFYATNGVSAWQGLVIISTADHEIIDIHTSHVLTCGVSPWMSLIHSVGKKGDNVDFMSYYERGIFEKDYGIFEIIDTVDEILISPAP